MLDSLRVEAPETLADGANAPGSGPAVALVKDLDGMPEPRGYVDGGQSEAEQQVGEGVAGRVKVNHRDTGLTAQVAEPIGLRLRAGRHASLVHDHVPGILVRGAKGEPFGKGAAHLWRLGPCAPHAPHVCQGADVGEHGIHVASMEAPPGRIADAEGARWPVTGRWCSGCGWPISGAATIHPGCVAP